MDRKADSLDAPTRERESASETGNTVLVHAYASLAQALPFVARREQFVAADVAERLVLEFSPPNLPLPSAPLEGDTELVERLSCLPQPLKDDWNGALPADSDGGPACLMQAMAACGEVSLEAVEGLSDQLMGHLTEVLAERYSITPDMARYLAGETRNEAITRALERAPQERIEAFMSDLESRGELSSERVLDYARRGNSRLFHAALGRCAGLSADMVEAFIEDGGLPILDRILMRTEFMQVMREAIVSTYRDAAGEIDA